MPLSPITVEMTVAESTQQYDMTVATEINPIYPVSGTISITQNGLADVTQYASASVLVQDSYSWASKSGVVF